MGVRAAAPAAVSAAVRRRRVLAVLCGLAFAVVFPAALVDARLWVVQAAADVLVAGYLLQARRGVVKARARRRAAEWRRDAAGRAAAAAGPGGGPRPAPPAPPPGPPPLSVSPPLTAQG